MTEEFTQMFPSLKGKVFDRYWRGIEKIDPDENPGCGQLVYYKDIQKYCRDKTVVREVILKVLDADYHQGHSRPLTKQHYKELIQAFNKELRLDKDD